MSSLLTGQSKDHIIPTTEPAARINSAVKQGLKALWTEAKKAGFDLQVASSFRDFDSQLAIWNRKARGERPLLDDQGKVLDFKRLTPEQVVFSILRWSALPGASRHHWGTDIDVFDGNALPAGYQVQLTPEEVAPQGIFGPFHAWLDENLARFNFYRPYHRDRGGVSPERWHISYFPVADAYLTELTIERVRAALAPVTMELKPFVLDRLEELYARFVINIEPSPSKKS